MEQIVSDAAAFFGLAVFLALFGFIMALGRVGRNGFFGVRCRTSMASEENWQRINRFSGLVCMGAAVIQFLLVAWMFVAPEVWLPLRGWVTPLLFVPLATAGVLIWLKVRRVAHEQRPQA